MSMKNQIDSNANDASPRKGDAMQEKDNTGFKMPTEAVENFINTDKYSDLTGQRTELTMPIFDRNAIEIIRSAITDGDCHKGAAAIQSIIVMYILQRSFPKLNDEQFYAAIPRQIYIWW